MQERWANIIFVAAFSLFVIAAFGLSGLKRAPEPRGMAIENLEIDRATSRMNFDLQQNSNGPGSGNGQAGESSDALRALVAAFEREFNTHDPSDLSSFFAEDADMIMGDGPTVRGRQTIQGWWGRYFEGQDPERRASFAIRSVRRLDADLALFDTSTTTGGRDAQGQELPHWQTRETWLLACRNGEWRILAMRVLPAERSQRDPMNDGSSVWITAVSPGVETALRTGDRVSLRVDVEYTLAQESATLGLVVQTAEGSSIAQFAEVVLKGRGNISLPLDFTVPPTSTFWIFTPLTPQGLQETSIVDARAFKVVPAESGRE